MGWAHPSLPRLLPSAPDTQSFMIKGCQKSALALGDNEIKLRMVSSNYTECRRLETGRLLIARSTWIFSPWKSSAWTCSPCIFHRQSTFLKFSHSRVQIAPWCSVEETGSRKRMGTWGLSVADRHELSLPCWAAPGASPETKQPFFYLCPRNLVPSSCPTSSFCSLFFNFLTTIFPSLMKRHLVISREFYKYFDRTTELGKVN